LVGKRIKRADSPERLTGAVRYTGDLFLPGLPRARLVRSPYAAARIAGDPGGVCIANAVRNAVGVRITELPLTSELVMQAIQCSQQLD